jgi:Zn-dependent peptidase ImmA (M78 family)
MLKPRLRYDRHLVPILSKDGIDTLGEAFVRDFNPDAMAEPLPLDVDRFLCDYLGMVQDFAYLSNDGRYLGMTVFNDTRRVIVYDPERNEADYMPARAGTVIIDNTLLADGKEHRYRFTMGHEGGHGILHTDYFAYDPDQMCFEDTGREPVIQCRADAPSILRRKSAAQWTPEDRMEWQANRLSSALLMPRSMVYRLVRSLPQEKSVDFDIMAILTVADTFNVSNEAAQYRLLDFGLIRSRAPIQTLLDFADAI